MSASLSLTPPRLDAGIWDFMESYINNASEADYPPALRALAVKNELTQRIPPPEDRGQGVRL